MPDVAQEMRAEACATPAYSATALKEGVDAGKFLMNLAIGLEDGQPRDVCCEVPEEAFDSDADEKVVDLSMFGTTSLLCFAKLVEDVEIGTVVKVLYTQKNPPVGHIVVLGPHNFQLCTCLQILRTGLPCSHVLAVLIQLKCTKEFSGASLHPRWRHSSEKWSITNAGLRAFDGQGLGPSRGGFTDDMQDMEFGDCQDDVAPKAALSVLRGRAFANLTEQCTRAVKLCVDNLQADDSSMLRRGQEIVERMHRDMFALVEAGAGPADPHHNAAKVFDPPIRPSNNRKESRTKDCLCRGRVKKEREICPGVM